MPHHTSHHATPHHATPHHATPCHTLLHTTPRHATRYFTPHHTTPHHTTPHHTTPHHTTPHHTTPHHTTPRNTPHHTTPHTTLINIPYLTTAHQMHTIPQRHNIIKETATKTSSKHVALPSWFTLLLICQMTCSLSIYLQWSRVNNPWFFLKIAKQLTFEKWNSNAKLGATPVVSQCMKIVC